MGDRSVQGLTVSVAALICMQIGCSPIFAQQQLGDGEQGITKEYDRFENTTTVMANVHDLRSAFKDGRPFHLAMTYACSGDTGCVPEEIKLMFFALDDTELYSELDLIFLLDGEDRVPVGNINATSEFALAQVPLTEAETIAQAEKIEYRLGSHEDRLRQDELEVLKEFMKRASQPPDN